MQMLFKVWYVCVFDLIHYPTLVNRIYDFDFLQLTKNTTPMYRAPEMLDLYQNFPINESVDIWVCIYFLMVWGFLHLNFKIKTNNN